MTLHVVYNHECPECQAFYIPYDQDVPCPNCGAIEQERFDYIPQAVASMKVNKIEQGSYTPGAWWVGSLGDHILSILFNLFDSFENESHQNAFEDFIRIRLAKMEWGDQEYLRDHIFGIALRINETLTTK